MRNLSAQAFRRQPGTPSRQAGPAAYLKGPGCEPIRGDRGDDFLQVSPIPNSLNSIDIVTGRCLCQMLGAARKALNCGCVWNCIRLYQTNYRPVRNDEVR